MAMVLLAAAGTTATVGRIGVAIAQERRADDATPGVRTETTEPEPDEPVIVTTWPTQLEFRPSAGDTVVPLTPLHSSAGARRGSWTTRGMLIGTAIGVVAGLLIGGKRDDYQRAHPEANCDPLCGGNTFGDATLLGLLGLGIGAAIGAIAQPSGGS
jgi:hypothetical protein